MDVTDLPIKYDAKFADRVQSMSWQKSSQGYARHCWSEGGRFRWVSMHRLVWSWEYGWDKVPRYIDHINGDRMDNRLENLRPTTLSLNAHNSRRKQRSAPLPPGVYLNRLSRISPYGACISHQNKTIYLGVFTTVEEASASYRDAKRKVMEHEASIAVGVEPPPVELEIKRGKRGRPKRMEVEQAREMHASGQSVAVIAGELGCCVHTARRLLRDAGVSLRRGPRPQKNTLTLDPSSVDCTPVQCPNGVPADDYGNNHGECGEAAGTEDVEVGQADDELLGSLDGEEGWSDDMD